MPSVMPYVTGLRKPGPKIRRRATFISAAGPTRSFTRPRPSRTRFRLSLAFSSTFHGGDLVRSNVRCTEIECKSLKKRDRISPVITYYRLSWCFLSLSLTFRNISRCGSRSYTMMIHVCTCVYDVYTHVNVYFIRYRPYLMQMHVINVIYISSSHSEFRIKFIRRKRFLTLSHDCISLVPFGMAD